MTTLSFDLPARRGRGQTALLLDYTGTKGFILEVASVTAQAIEWVPEERVLRTFDSSEPDYHVEHPSTGDVEVRPALDLTFDVPSANAAGVVVDRSPARRRVACTGTVEDTGAVSGHGLTIRPGATCSVPLSLGGDLTTELWVRPHGYPAQSEAIWRAGGLEIDLTPNGSIACGNASQPGEQPHAAHRHLDPPRADLHGRHRSLFDQRRPAADRLAALAGVDPGSRAPRWHRRAGHRRAACHPHGTCGRGNHRGLAPAARPRTARWRPGGPRLRPPSGHRRTTARPVRGRQRRAHRAHPPLPPGRQRVPRRDRARHPGHGVHHGWREPDPGPALGDPPARGRGHRRDLGQARRPFPARAGAPHRQVERPGCARLAPRLRARLGTTPLGGGRRGHAARRPADPTPASRVRHLRATRGRPLVPRGGDLRRAAYPGLHRRRPRPPLVLGCRAEPVPHVRRTAAARALRHRARAATRGQTAQAPRRRGVHLREHRQPGTGPHRQRRAGPPDARHGRRGAGLELREEGVRGRRIRPPRVGLHAGPGRADGHAQPAPGHRPGGRPGRSPFRLVRPRRAPRHGPTSHPRPARGR